MRPRTTDLPNQATDRPVGSRPTTAPNEPGALAALFASTIHNRWEPR